MKRQLETWRLCHHDCGPDLVPEPCPLHGLLDCLDPYLLETPGSFDLWKEMPCPSLLPPDSKHAVRHLASGLRKHTPCRRIVCTRSTFVSYRSAVYGTCRTWRWKRWKRPIHCVSSPVREAARQEVSEKHEFCWYLGVSSQHHVEFHQHVASRQQHPVEQELDPWSTSRRHHRGHNQAVTATLRWPGEAG